MNRRSFLSKNLVWVICLAGLICLDGPAQNASSEKNTRKIRLQLVWGTNEEKSPDENHKRLDAKHARKLRMFKWKHYFLVNESVVEVKQSAPVKTRLSKECEVQLKDAGNDMLEVELWGKGKLTRRIKEKVTSEDSLTIAGDAENDSAWLILIKEVK